MFWGVWFLVKTTVAALEPLLQLQLLLLLQLEKPQVEKPLEGFAVSGLGIEQAKESPPPGQERGARCSSVGVQGRGGLRAGTGCVMFQVRVRNMGKAYHRHNQF